MRLPVLSNISLFLPVMMLAASVQAQDPFAEPEVVRHPVAEIEGPAIFSMIEWIEVDQGEFSRWLLDHQLKTDATELRREVQEWIEAGEAALLESAVIQSISGATAGTEATNESIYPTEYSYTEISGAAGKGKQPKEKAGLMKPQAFETRNAGMRFEIEAVAEEDSDRVRMSIQPEIVTLKGFKAWPSEDVPENHQALQPNFFCSSVRTDLRLKSGCYSLLGSTKLPAEEEGEPDRFVLLFVRADVDDSE